MNVPLVLSDGGLCLVLNSDGTGRVKVVVVRFQFWLIWQLLWLLEVRTSE